MTERVALAAERVESPGASRAALFVHGILGSGTNLRTVARRFVAERPDHAAWLVDLRGHGASPKGTPSPSVEAAARDLSDLAGRLAREGAGEVGLVLGHSFGGKVALEAVRAGMRPAHVFLVDSSPGARTPDRGPTAPLDVIETIAAIGAVHASRDAFVGALGEARLPRSIAQWLAMSLERDLGSSSGVRFALDLDEIRGLLASYYALDRWDVVESPPEGVRVHVVIGERSRSFAPEDRARARAAAARSERVTVDVLPTDHWVHAEDPEGLLRVMLGYV